MELQNWRLLHRHPLFRVGFELSLYLMSLKLGPGLHAPAQDCLIIQPDFGQSTPQCAILLQFPQRQPSLTTPRKICFSTSPYSFSLQRFCLSLEGQCWTPKASKNPDEWRVEQRRLVFAYTYQPNSWWLVTPDFSSKVTQPLKERLLLYWQNLQSLSGRFSSSTQKN